MLPPEGPNPISSCGEKQPLDESQHQSVLVQQKNGKNYFNAKVILDKLKRITNLL